MQSHPLRRLPQIPPAGFIMANYVRIVKEWLRHCQHSDVSLDIKRRISLVNSYFYDFNRQLSSRELFRMTELILYQTLVPLWFLMTKKLGYY